MKNFLKLSLVLATAVVMTGCNCFKQMSQNPDAVKVTATPEILALNNGVVAADILVTFPAEYFNAKAILKVTPVLVYTGGEVAGTTKYFQGEKVVDNYTVVGAESGGSFTLPAKFTYKEGMERCELQLRAEIKCPKGACKAFTLVNLNTGALPTSAQQNTLDEGGKQAMALRKQFGLTVAYGLNTLQKDLKYGDLMEPMANNYKKVTTTVTKTDMRYAINSSKITDENRRDANLDIFRADVDNKRENSRATQNISVKGYASPDGPEKYNDKLSKARSESSKEIVEILLEDTGLTIDAAAYGEDWDGFRELIQQSDIKDKNLILQVLSLYNSPAERENEIKNLSSVYEELKNEILPELRRSQIINSTDVEGNSDEHILREAKAGGELTVEEYLYAAEMLTELPEEQVKLLTSAARHYDDARVYNNLGVALAKMGANELALKSFEKAAKFDSSVELNKNLMLANLANGNTEEAKKYQAAVDQKGKAALALAEGNYAAAQKQLTGYNAAIASVMTNDLAAAKKAIAEDKSADADYLRAVIAAKQGDIVEAKAQLALAISKNPDLEAKAANDILLKEVVK